MFCHVNVPVGREATVCLHWKGYEHCLLPCHFRMKLKNGGSSVVKKTWKSAGLTQEPAKHWSTMLLSWTQSFHLVKGSFCSFRELIWYYSLFPKNTSTISWISDCSLNLWPVQKRSLCLPVLKALRFLTLGELLTYCSDMGAASKVSE